MAIGQRNVSLEEFLTWPEQDPPLELFDGEVSPKAMAPSLPHAFVQAALVGLINGFARPRKLGLAGSEARARIAGASPVPDVTFYRWTQIPRGPSGRPLRYPTEPPDLVIEIASPDQRRADQEARCRRFREAGVPIVLLVLPEDEVVLDFRPAAEPHELRGSDRINFDGLLPGFELTVQELFDSAYGR